MRNLEAELSVAVRALEDIAQGKANNGVPYYLAQIRTIAREALEDMQQMQLVGDAQRHDRGEW